MLGHQWYKFYVKIPYSLYAFEKLAEMRTWCWEQWGPAREVNRMHSVDQMKLHAMNPGVNIHFESYNEHWSWCSDEQRPMRIYLKDKEEAALFTLRWS